ncbi:MAG: hypothetical protein CMD22_02310 [Flavobacteriales bacterium]|nr:hypothetical protein [Flavobacteriales bacterium]|tara:strand:- start:1270 stop:2271 length:1002 start_codon:yes stop_codon:yes gene_type:complete
MELITFIILLFIGIITIVSENRYYLWGMYLPILCLFIIVVRMSGLDTDMITYAKEMTSTGYDFYYLREIVFWYSLRFFHQIFNNEIIVFLFMDIIWIAILYKTSVNLSKTSSIKNNLSLGLIVILSTSFPLFFGYQNIYRQLFATIVSLYSYSIINSSYKKSIFYFCVSVFIHNISLVLIPIFFVNKLLKLNIYFRVFLSLIVSVAFIMLFSYASQFKSAKSTGVDMSLIYLIMFVSFLILYLIKFKFRILDLFRKTPSLMIVIILMIGLFSLRFDMISERLGMMFLVFFIFDLYKYSNTIIKYSNRMIFRLFLLLIFSVPVLLFNSSRLFLI